MSSAVSKLKTAGDVGGESSSKEVDLAIIGAGPVGLACALAAHKHGLSPVIIERAAAPSTHSRAIGIHPVSLDYLQLLGVVEPLIAAGLPVRRGRAMNRHGDVIGELRFDRLPPPFRFVLALPQGVTESILEQALIARGGEIRRNTELLSVQQQPQHVRLDIRDAEGVHRQLIARFVVGCDGKHSLVRRQAAIQYDGAAYPDLFLMGDFDDNTSLGDEAAVFLHRDGLIESFPLLGVGLERARRLRRWVVKVEAYQKHLEPHVELRNVVHERLGHDLRNVAHAMQSRFGVQHYLARRFVKGRIALAGDAAHVVSPIGGQGMNLGFKDVERLALSLAAAVERDDPTRLSDYCRKSRAVAKRATRRSALYMALGRRRKVAAVRDGLVKLLLATPASQLAAWLFTMRGLEDGAF
jgi:2-polyprenyl-6-methoxyphenol hydroxylase-like FAD-dependent oxidoreductase